MIEWFHLSCESPKELSTNLYIHKARIRYVPFWTTWWNASVTSVGGLITLYLGYLSGVLANEGVGRFDASKAFSG